MIEIRFHGRGGQGAVVAAKILADAFFREGKHVQSFPAFGVERRGAPVTAFTRIDHAPILIRCNIYQPDIVVVLDPTILNETDVTGGLKQGGMIILNAPRKETGIQRLEQFLVATVDATAIAVRHGLGTNTNPIVNTAILGSFARATGVVGIESVLASIREGVPKGPEENAAAAREAYEHTQELTTISEKR
ncbi:MAG: pyruvate ferredoxin oxidoreductase [Candidatus Abyssobacteria bacterium SURF_17]|jgi:2-oxoacid:acceptor oxidoreductase gamma subunit (pyruvate/2-ketoisovalerate family)|uniref:Pyruvate ferredoxin oxidoreductase n=1 Tax=Candidatus Abyssobacteria bacterium SURF_17 TaxID=2093361 RepID=A0A419F120_9BACT|nr:MAG: pyruvate ferredoxin oxidoreductase [Candidatus Abyssubacteria bacterium SURF_17]